MDQIGIEVFLAAVYSIFLLVVAAVLERLALGCHRRSHGIHNIGFTFRAELDAWQCPARQFLTRSAADNNPKLVIYRAPARICNGCAWKPGCTDSDDGREITAFPDSWFQSQLGRFHRGLSLSLCVLAGLLVAVEFFRDRTSPERILLVCLLVLITAFAKRLAAGLRPP